MMQVKQRWFRAIAPLVSFAMWAAVAPPTVSARGHFAAPRQEPQASQLLPIPNARIPLDGVLSGGQPTQEQLEAAAKAGFRTVINLRTESEPGFEWEAAAVKELGMRYVHIPVAGASGLTRGTVEQVDEALRAAESEGPVLLHCASGNRIGAVLALRAAWVEDIDPKAALAFGKSAGMTGLEPATRHLLGLGDSD